MFFTPIFIVFTLFLLANAQTTTTYITTTYITTTYKKITHTATRSLKPTAVLPNFMAAVATPTAVQEYLHSITREPQFTSALEAIDEALPDESYGLYVMFGISPFGSWPVAGEEPSWMGEIPASHVSYISSFLARESMLMTATATATGSAPTNRPRVEVVGAALAVGAAGLAML